MLRTESDARIGLARVGPAACLHVPVENAADEGRDQKHAGLRAGLGLGLGEQEREIAVDAFLLEDLRGADALPGRRDLDQDALAPDAALLVGLDDARGLFRASPRCRRTDPHPLRSRRGPARSPASSAPKATASRSQIARRDGLSRGRPGLGPRLRASSTICAVGRDSRRLSAAGSGWWCNPAASGGAPRRDRPYRRRRPSWRAIGRVWRASRSSVG